MPRHLPPAADPSRLDPRAIRGLYPRPYRLREAQGAVWPSRGTGGIERISGLRHVWVVSGGSRVTTRARAAGRPREWMSLGEAAEALGVAPTTLRRWADDGLVRSFVTPGGHRRFMRESIDALVPGEKRQRPSLDRLGGTPERMARAYRRDAGHAGADSTWVGALDGSERDPLRERGRALAGALLAYLDATPGPDRDARLDEASAVAADYGRLARAHGATVHQTVETYLRFSRPFVAELATLARRRNLDTTEATELLETILAAMDRLLLETIAAHESAAPGAPGSLGAPDDLGHPAPAPLAFIGPSPDWIDGGPR